ncbi:thiol:disulfide interchange protein DsbA/DsbL [Lysobacter sp. GX 14042]|uniref:thiol:disulfide interchange protein DsbA/DsbL n=1 Tax=Lysobacter sp. GX 14042 TaxID=2907155 RepID=UPI001F238219|nr:thiol:disulfide interchange protein DsbA/DsbL [Lysobacter sp. GX 14042]MCE7033450.1 thiol:disulfide interchange protein DsbA/DsbL [Lysobacter sp. GX 14042]
MKLRFPHLPRLGLVLTAALALAACGQDAPAPAAPATTPTQAAAPAGTTAAPAAAPAAGQQQAAPAPERTPGPVVPPQGPAPVAGTDYVEIASGQPYKPGNPHIEVVEGFGYTCPACAQFEPLVTAWAARLPADVEFIPVPAPFGGFWMPYAKAYYAAEAAGVLEQSHDAMFDAFHVRRQLDHESTEPEIAQFYGQFGVDPQEFARTMSSFAVNAKLNRARQFLQRTGVDSTPTLVIDGRYRVIGGTSWEDKLRIADHLIAMRREARGSTAEAPAQAGGAGAAPAGEGEAPAETDVGPDGA